MQTVRSLILGVKLWSGRNKFSSERIIKCKRNKLGFQTLSHRITGKTRLNAAESELMLSTFSLSHSIEWPKKHQSAVRCSAARKSRMDLFVPWLLGYQAHIHLAHPTVGCSGQVLHKVSELEREREAMNAAVCSLSLALVRIDFMSCGRLEVYRKPNYKHTDRRRVCGAKILLPC
jgi:hypothetical protein